jgi:putative copper resistance protein D
MLVGLWHAGGMFVGAADAPSPHVEPGVLLTYFQTSDATLVVDGLLTVVAVTYFVGVGAVGRHRRPLRLEGPTGPGDRGGWPAGQTACFVAGLLCIFVAVGSGLAAYDDLNPSAHMVQHALLMMVGAPLLVAGQPLVLLAQAGPRSVQRAVVRTTGSRWAAVLTGPVAWILYFGSMAGYLLTPLYADSVRDQAVHDAVHAWFLMVGCLYWTGVLGPDGYAHRRSLVRRAVAVMAGMPVEAALGLALVIWPWPLAPGYTLAATHAAGQVFWMTAMVTGGVAVAALVHRWIVTDERRVRRLDERAERAERAVIEPGVGGGP